jgi:arylsulfatase A-like enzyme
MDDVGIDQMRSFGYGGTAPPSMPNINAISNAGVRFRNTWSMPECSPGRASMFVGRYPFRTNVYGAIGQDDLANSQLSPYDMTTPKLLKQANYESGMFGKFHLAGPDNNQAGNGTPAALGWDYFYGWLGADPGSIDTTAGGVAPTGTYACGFVPDANQGGANSGACYLADNSCSDISGPSPAGDVPGKQCLIRGGIFKPLGTCQNPPPAGLNFDRENAYYVSPLVINSADGVQSIPLTDSRNRGYRTTLEANEAIRWIKGRSPSKPWMATVSFSSAHTPFQQAPSSLTPSTVGGGDGLNCLNLLDQRVLQNQMTEAMDTEFGRLLSHIDRSNTVVIFIGDNGTPGPVVQPPVSSTRGKFTLYEGGIRVPMIISGPVVANPHRENTNLVHTADLFATILELAGVNLQEVLPTNTICDSHSLLPILTNGPVAPRDWVGTDEWLTDE